MCLIGNFLFDRFYYCKPCASEMKTTPATIEAKSTEILFLIHSVLTFSPGSIAPFISKLELVDMATAAPDYTISRHSAR